MLEISNPLLASAFTSGPEVNVTLFLSEINVTGFATSPELRVVGIKPGRTPNPRRPEALSVIAIPKGSELGGWVLKAPMVIQIRQTRKTVIATAWLEGIVEYGHDTGMDGAILDLVTSVGEYRDTLEQRQASLGDSALKELNYLRNLIEQQSTK